MTTLNARARIGVALTLVWLSFLSATHAAPPKTIRWVWDDTVAAQSSNNDPRYFRRSFELTGKVTSAKLEVTADNNYVAFVNGQKVGGDGNWNKIESYDVAKLLKPGKNVVAIDSRNGGGQAGMLAWLTIVTVDKKQLVVGSDSEMRVSLAAGEGWQKATFDDAKWLQAAPLGEAGMEPWNLFGGGGGVAQSGTPQAGTSNAADRSIQKRLSASEQHPHFILPDDFEIELVAAEPQIINPITMTVAANGDIYISESHTYRYGPKGTPIKPFSNPIVRLEPLANGKGYRRVVVAEGFEEPVMGIAIRDGKMWCTANNYLYQFDLDNDGKAVNRRTLLVDRNKAWNPFGMFVLEFGPDGLLYLSVGNHNIDIGAPTAEGEQKPEESITGRGSSGIVMRMNPDGRKMQRLVHGLRVPYSFEYDPFGQLWVLSNGQGNPNRFLRVLDGVDYHCYSRKVSGDWLTGRHPLSPPCFEQAPGARTQLLRYYGAAYPGDYQGNLFLDNWGAHGFAGRNRSVFRYTLDENNNVDSKQAFVSCADPHFRCSHIALDPDGNMLVADWYGRDDESDLTGRIWRVKYKGKEPTPKVVHQLKSADWSKADYAIRGLGSPHHLVRAQAVEQLVALGDQVVPSLAKYAATAEQPLGAAHATWSLLRIDTPKSLVALSGGAKHADWRVRRQVVNTLRRYELPQAEKVAKSLSNDENSAVRVEAALALTEPAQLRAALMSALEDGAADDAHLRYEAAWHLAKHADMKEGTFKQLLFSENENMRLAGLIALDVACYEQFPSKAFAVDAIAARLADPGPVDPKFLLEIVKSVPDAAVVEGLQRLIARSDVPPAVIAGALLTLRSMPGGVSDELIEKAGSKLLSAVESGDVRLQSTTDWLMLLKLLENSPVNEFAIRQLNSLSGNRDAQLRAATHALARKWGDKASALAPSLWRRASDKRQKVDQRLQGLSTLRAIEAEPNIEMWAMLLSDPVAEIRTDAVRSWRQFKGRREAIDILVKAEATLVKNDAGVSEDLAIVLNQLGVKRSTKPRTDKTKLAAEVLKGVASLSSSQKKTAPLLGRRIFERSACMACHTTITGDSPRAPSLKGLGKAQKPQYLVESLLHPSKVIKTGFLSESIVTTDGKVISGLVREEGESLHVYEAERDYLLPKSKVDERSVLKVSLMPEGQEQQWSHREFVDLVAFLMSL